MKALKRFAWLWVLLLGIASFVVYRVAHLDGRNWLLLLGLALVVAAIALYVVSLRRQSNF